MQKQYVLLTNNSGMSAPDVVVPRPRSSNDSDTSLSTFGKCLIVMSVTTDVNCNTIKVMKMWTHSPVHHRSIHYHQYKYHIVTTSVMTVRRQNVSRRITTEFSSHRLHRRPHLWTLHLPSSTLPPKQIHHSSIKPDLHEPYLIHTHTHTRTHARTRV